MNLTDVMAELAAKLESTGARVSDYAADSIHPPAAFVGMPERIDFDQTYGRGSDTMTVPVVVLVARTDARAGHTLLKPYADGAGPKSVKAALDSSDTNTYVSCDIVRVSTVEFPVYVAGDIKYLSAEFSVDIEGGGS